jgi:hypothetical protein
MKLVRNLSLALVMAFSITAAADDKKPAPAPAKDAPAASAPAPAKADVDKWLAFFDKLVDIVVADKDACPKMATDVGAHIDANADLLKKAQEAEDKGQKLPKDAEDHMKASAQKMMGGMQKCMNDKGVQAAFSKLMTKKDKAKETK